MKDKGFVSGANLVLTGSIYLMCVCGGGGGAIVDIIVTQCPSLSVHLCDVWLRQH